MAVTATILKFASVDFAGGQLSVVDFRVNLSSEQSVVSVCVIAVNSFSGQ
jgi:hypothetical protein